MTTEGRDQRKGWFIAVAIVAVIAAAGFGWFVGKATDSSASAAITLVPAGSPGPDPFTASVAVGRAVDFPTNVRAVNAKFRKDLTVDSQTHTLVAEGTAPGLYGGSGNTRLCKSQQLVAFLNANPSKARAWARVFGIRTDEIESYVSGLTPVLLANDTRVTNYGYRNGRANPFQAVLQAGTAVLVDATGTPRVKCNCGNPLTPPTAVSLTDGHTTGDPWPGYAPAEVTAVRPGPTVATITVVNISTGDQETTSVGGNGGGGGQFVATVGNDQGTATTLQTSPDGTTWTTVATVNARLHGLAYGDGKWLALGGGNDSQVLESTDLKTWKQVATMSTFLADLAYGDGRWLAVGLEGTEDDGSGAVFGSTNGRTWNRFASVPHSSGLAAVAYGDGKWVTVTAGHQGGDTDRTYSSPDGRTWTKNNDQGLGSQAGGEIAYNSGKWVLGGTVVLNTRSDYRDGIISVSDDAQAWSPASGPFTNNRIDGVAYGNGGWLAISTSGAFKSSDAESWTRLGSLNTGADDLAFGVVSGSAAAPTAGGSSSGNGLESFDFRSYSYRDYVCGTDQLQKFTDGQWQGTPAVDVCGMSIEGVDFADLTGDGKAEAIVTGTGAASGTVRGQSSWTTVFTKGPNGPVIIGRLSGAAFPPYSKSSGVSVWSRRYQGTDPGCCPSTYDKSTFKYDRATRKLRKTGSQLLPTAQLPTR